LGVGSWGFRDAGESCDQGLGHSETMTHPGRVVFFTGPAAAGKSTIAAAWAASRSTPTAHADHDQARFLVRGGYVSRTAAYADPSLREQADQQWLLAAAVCEAMAATYSAWGFDLAVSAFRPPGQWKGCWERLDALHPIIIVLLPALGVLLARDAQREGRSHVGEGSVRRGFAYDWGAWRTDERAYVIDNSELSVEQVVGLVEAEVLRRIVSA
jgi:chloramphenicol 3-O-phosphotransferase